MAGIQFMRTMEPLPWRMVPCVMEPTAAVAMRSTRAEEGSLVGFCANDGNPQRRIVRRLRVRAISIV